MDLDHITLPGFVVSELFPHALLAGTPAKSPPGDTAPKKEQAPGYKFLGNNQRRVSIIVQAKDAVFVPEPQLAFLTKMLEACRMNIGDVAIVNHDSTPVIIAALKNQLHPDFVLLFGVSPTDIQLPLSFPQFKTQSFDGSTYLYVPSLGEIDQPGEESRAMKTKLWGCLRTLFGL